MEIHYSDLVVDLLRQEMLCKESKVKLSTIPFRVLVLLVENADSIVSRKDLLEKVWGHTFDPGTKVLDVQLSRLRRELREMGSSTKIVNSRGAGFRMRV